MEEIIIQNLIMIYYLAIFFGAIGGIFMTLLAQSLAVILISLLKHKKCQRHITIKKVSRSKQT